MFMKMPEQTKDIVYNLLQEPTLDKFREFLHSQMGEHNAIEFKGQWIEKAALAKEMLAMANSQGGFIVFGVAENEDKTTRSDGLPEFRDKAVISNEISKFISSNLDYDIYSFQYDTAEYEALKGKKFQMLVVDDTPQYIPFLARQDSGTLKKNMIYVRRGTACEIANEEEIHAMLNRRINYLHPLNGKPLNLEEHLEQLKTLYKEIKENHIHYKNTLGNIMSYALTPAIKIITEGEKVVEPNPFYPEESYEQFISRMITAKKKKIERVMDLY